MKVQGTKVERQGEAETEDLEYECRNSDSSKAERPHKQPRYPHYQGRNEVEDPAHNAV